MYSNDIFVEIIDMIYISLCRYSNNGVSIVMMNSNVIIDITQLLSISTVMIFVDIIYIYIFGGVLKRVVP